MVSWHLRDGAGDVLGGYRTAWHFARPLFTVYVLVRLLALAVFAPLASLLLSLAIATSGKSAFTDQEIAYFLLTPSGLVACLLAGTLLILAFALDVSIMTAVLRTGDRSMLGALENALRLTTSRSPVLFRFLLRLIVKVAALAVPFAAVAGIIAWFTLRSHDINYYLTYWPTSFVVAAMAIALVLLAGAVLLAWKLSGWGIALHLVVFGHVAPAEAFAGSIDRLAGRRPRLVSGMIAWIILRTLLALVPAMLAGLLIEVISPVFGARLDLAVGMIVLVMLLWALADAFIDVLSNGALSALLYRHYRHATPDEPKIETAPAPQARHARGLLRPVAIAGLAALLAVIAGFVTADSLLDGVGTPQTVEIIAHRGAAALRPENTLAAIDKALDDKADWVEIDVQETADGEVIVAHDSDFMKTAGNGLKVWDATMENIAAIDIGSWFGADWSDERPPTLRQVLETAQGRGRVIIELKYYRHDVDLERRVGTIVEQTGMADAIAVMSLKSAGIEKMRALHPDWRYGILAARALGNLTALDADFLAVNTGQVSRRLIDRAHAQAKQVYAWTVDDPLMMSRMISMGIDGLITNNPALARRIMVARNELDTYERLLLWLVDRFRIGSFDLVASEKDG